MNLCSLTEVLIPQTNKKMEHNYLRTNPIKTLRRLPVLCPPNVTIVMKNHKKAQNIVKSNILGSKNIVAPAYNLGLDHFSALLSLNAGY